MQLVFTMRIVTDRLFQLLLAFSVAALLATLANAAEKQGLLYTISKQGELRGYLLGTVHSDDPRVLNFSEPFMEALQSCDRFAMELVPDQPTLSRLMDYMNYQDGTTLESRIGAERYARVLEAASAYHLRSEQLTNMKVWAAMMTFSIPPPKNGLFMDLSLALQAAGLGLKVVGLETLDEQLSFLEDMPERYQLVLLDQALDEHENIHGFYQELISDYVKADLEALQRSSESQFEELPDEVEQYFYSKGIDARNFRMRDRLLVELAAGTVFTAVGALHLPGETGLIALLRAEGYAVEPVTFRPFVD